MVTEGEVINLAWDHYEFAWICLHPRRPYPWLLPIIYFFLTWRAVGSYHMLEIAASRWAPDWLRGCTGI